FYRDANPNRCEARILFKRPSDRHRNHLTDRESLRHELGQIVGGKRSMNIKGIFEVLALALALNPQVFADTTSALNTEASRMNTLAASHGEANVTGKISGTFNSFLGSDSPAVVTGLRNGTPITLTTTTPAATPGAAP